MDRFLRKNTFPKVEMTTTGGCICGKLTYSFNGEPTKKVSLPSLLI